ncbi:MAG: hypothetical protein BAJATHORv1_30057 [Candidatus Thorarchaeota archaeon]|nr:MAG: hypothetical protein BAJATHORv1_30057 [Candidatus Thorarchaeota archaeon]
MSTMIKECPFQAILEEAIVNDSSLITKFRQNECFEYFVQYYGCSTYAKVGLFSKGMNAFTGLITVVEKRKISELMKS